LSDFTILLWTRLPFRRKQGESDVGRYLRMRDHRRSEKETLQKKNRMQGNYKSEGFKIMGLNRRRARIAEMLFLRPKAAGR
jgi:hypothetical protein